jgi:hypothetical protein
MHTVALSIAVGVFNSVICCIYIYRTMLLTTDYIASLSQSRCLCLRVSIGPSTVQEVDVRLCDHKCPHSKLIASTCLLYAVDAFIPPCAQHAAEHTCPDRRGAGCVQCLKAMKERLLQGSSCANADLVENAW